MLVMTENLQTTLSRILVGKGRTSKGWPETKEWHKARGCGLGFGGWERLVYVYRCMCWAHTVFPEDAHGLWGQPIW